MPATETVTALQIGRKTAPIAVRRSRTLTLAEFRRRYSDKQDGFKYEFNNGVIEKYQRNMNIKQYHIVRNITRRFTKTSAYLHGSELGVEVEQLTNAEQMRRPDLCFIPAHKLNENDESISGFVIEIISPTDRADDISRKSREYFRAGVQVLWQIHPSDETVYVFTSPTQVTICEGTDVCSASPVLDDFEMTAAEVFAK